MKNCLLIIMLSCLLSCVSDTPKQTTTTTPTSQDQFFETLSYFCGKAYPGTISFALEGMEYYEGKPIYVFLEYCNKKEISIPFQIGEDRSKTWKISKQDGDLQLKHEDRDENDDLRNISNYGGRSNLQTSTPTLQQFPADLFTQKLIPVAASNQWDLELQDNNTILSYAIFREGALRFQAKFDLKKGINF